VYPRLKTNVLEFQESYLISISFIRHKSALSVAGDVDFKWLSAAMLYSFVLISTVSIIVGFNLAERFNIESSYASSFEDKIIEYAGRLFISSVFVIPISHWPETRNKMRLVNRWTQLQVWTSLHGVQGPTHTQNKQTNSMV
jgi:hypothetical protein